MSSFNDHGNAFKSEGFQPDYAPPPRFTLHATDDLVGQLAFKMKQEATSARIHAERLEQLCDQSLADEAFTQARAELTASMKACADALAEAIAYLTRNEPQMIAHPEKVRAA